MGILSEPLFAPRRLSGTWSADELAALDALYPKHGGVGCVPLLNRSLSSIYAKARARGLSAPEGVANENFRKVVPAHVDAEIRAFYLRGGPIARGEFQAFCARLVQAGKARELRLPCDGRADVVGVEVVQ